MQHNNANEADSADSKVGGVCDINFKLEAGSFNPPSAYLRVLLQFKAR